jgi:hypothetical protein
LNPNKVDTNLKSPKRYTETLSSSIEINLRRFRGRLLPNIEPSFANRSGALGHKEVGESSTAEWVFFHEVGEFLAGFDGGFCDTPRIKGILCVARTLPL